VTKSLQSGRRRERTAVHFTDANHPSYDGCEESAMKNAALLISAVLVFNCGAGNAETHIGFDTEKVDKNLVVSEIYEASMAIACGMREGDAVIAIGAVPVRTQKDVVRLTSKRKVGDWVPVKVRRREFTHTFNVTLVDGDEMRKKSKEAAIARKQASEKKFFADQKERSEATAAAVAADPELPSRLQTLLDEYEIIADSNASGVDKAVHCDRIADCYLKMRDKESYKQWKTQSRIHMMPPTTGRAARFP
jgi:hypothetical protein